MRAHEACVNSLAVRAAIDKGARAFLNRRRRPLTQGWASRAWSPPWRQRLASGRARPVALGRDVSGVPPRGRLLHLRSLRQGVCGRARRRNAALNKASSALRRIVTVARDAPPGLRAPQRWERAADEQSRLVPITRGGPASRAWGTLRGTLDHWLRRMRARRAGDSRADVFPGREGRGG
jgi:hypothetical protein